VRTKAARGMIMATKRARERARAARWTAMATKMARVTVTGVAAMKRPMATAMKRAMATGGDNAGNGYGKEGDG
jgi:hypothetical protein